MKPPVIIHHKDNLKDDCFDLRMTLRSFEKNMPNLGEVVIVGDKPKWATNVIHVPYPNPYPSNKDANIIMACLKGAVWLMNEYNYDGDVIIASDDCVLMSEYVPQLYYEEKFRPFMDSFPKRLKATDWYRRPFNSMIHCLSLGLSCDSCEAHVHQFLSIGAILMAFEARLGDQQLGAKTLFVNAERSLGNRKAIQARQFKVHPDDVCTGRIPEDVRFCNWSPSSESDEFKEKLQEMFPTPSRYEHAN